MDKENPELDYDKLPCGCCSSYRDGLCGTPTCTPISGFPEWKPDPWYNTHDILIAWREAATYLAREIINCGIELTDELQLHESED